MSEETALTSGSNLSLSRLESGTRTEQNGDGGEDGLIAAKPVKKLKAKPVREVLGKVLPQLQRRDQYQFFAMPVPPAEVPEYYSIIQHPMDFSTMEKKLDEGEYKSVESFKNDFLLITENAQYFNAVDGPSGIIHTEAKKLQDWGLRVINREGAAAIEENNHESEELNTPQKNAAAAKAGKFNIRIKKFTSPHSSAAATPRTSTPSRLNQEIKMEEEDEEEDDGNRNEDSGEDFDGSSEAGTSYGRGASVSIDAFGTPGSRESPEAVRKYTKRAVGPRAPYTHKKNRPRSSAVIGLLSTSINHNHEEENEGRPSMAPVSSTSGAIAASIPLVFGSDGSIELDKLTEDERRAILRPAGLDDWPELLTPYLQSISPMHPDVQTNAQTLARPLQAIVDGFGSTILQEPSSLSSSFTYDVSNLPPDQQDTPFAISSGHIFDSKNGIPSIPLAWPRPTNAMASSNPSSSKNEVSTSKNESANAPIRILKGRDREKEREAAGVGNLDDWSFPRAHLARLLQPLDLGLYPGLLPSAWINHIRSSKGGPAKSRLPPFHLSMGPTFENALQDELTSLPYRAFLDGKPGNINTNTAQAAETHRDICTAISEGAVRDWKQPETEKMKAGVRGSDVIREVVFGGALGEAYANSVFDFIEGATKSVEARNDDTSIEEEEIVENPPISTTNISMPKVEMNRVVPSYFDDTGEMLDKEGYIGMGLIPLEVRKEAGLSSHSRPIQPLLSSPITSETTNEKKRGSREPSVLSAKRQRLASIPIGSFTDVKMEQDADRNNGESFVAHDGLDSLATAYLSGAILDKPLIDYVRDTIISPLTSGTLDILSRAGEEVEQLQTGKAVRSTSTYSDNLTGEYLERLFGEIPELEEKDFVPPQAPTDKDKQVEKLARKMVLDDYHRSRSLLVDLTRVKQDVIELDSLVRVKEEMLNEYQQIQADNLSLPLRWTSMELDSNKVAKSLHQYAKILEKMSNKQEESGKAKVDGATIDTETMNRLRLAYIALAKLAPTKELARGQWAAWAEYLQQQMAQQKQQLQGQIGQ